MKKYLLLLCLLPMLAGCSQPRDFETMSDQYIEPEMRPSAELVVALPADAARPTATGEDGSSLYLCDGYCIVVQTLPAGDLDGTLRQTTGYARDQLQLLERKEGEHRRYECVWTAAGEGEDQVGRAVILDDGEHHYVLSVMAGASAVGELTKVWQELFQSVSLRTAP